MRCGFEIRTTLAIDDDVLAAAKTIASHEGRSLGEAVSALARRALQRPQAPAMRNGIPLLPEREGGAISLEIVNALATRRRDLSCWTSMCSSR